MSLTDSGPANWTGHASTELERLVVVSSAWHEADTATRDALTPYVEEAALGLGERVVLRTCQRVEVVGLELEDGHARRTSEHGLSVWRGAQAAEHVLLVAGGLDSAVLGEDEILGQLRRSYQAALERGETGPVINELVRRAIHFGKRARSHTSNVTDRSLVDRALNWLRPRLLVAAGAPTAVVVGTGQVGRAAAGDLAAMGLDVTVVSRAAGRAAAVAQELGGTGSHRGVAIDDARALGIHAKLANVVVLAVRASSVRLEAAHLGDGRRPLVIDFSAPSAVGQEARAILGERLLDLDRLGGMEGTGRFAPRVAARLRAEARQEADRFARWVERRATGDTVALLRSHAAEVRARHLERLRGRNVLEPQQLEAVEAMTGALVGELLHAPTTILRRDPDAAASVRRLFGFD